MERPLCIPCNADFFTLSNKYSLDILLTYQCIPVSKENPGSYAFVWFCSLLRHCLLCSVYVQ